MNQVNPSENDKTAHDLAWSLEAAKQRSVQQYGKTFLLAIPDNVVDRMCISDGDCFTFVIKDDQHMLLIKS